MPDVGDRALRHAVRLRVVLRLVGELGLVLGIATLVPVIAALGLREWHVMVPYLAIAALLGGFGVLARRAAPPRDLQRNEALVVSVLAFVLSPLLLSIPLAAQGIPWADALFEAISGLTTTGLSTLPSVETLPRSLLLARGWMQWVGGLGFVVLSLAVVLGPGTPARRLGTSGLEAADLAGGMRAHARRVLLVYLALTALGVALLLGLGASAFDALVHVLAGVSTGGFSPRDASLAELPQRVRFGVLATSLLGAVSLPVYAGLARRRWRTLRDDPELRLLLALIVVAAGLLVLATRSAGTTAGVPLADLVLLATSAQTTAGFSSFPVTALPASATAVVVLSMLVGGSLGSTAGGIKLQRILVLARLVRWQVARTRLPSHAVSVPMLSGERLEADVLLRAATVTLLFLAVILSSCLPFLFHGYEPMQALFEVVSATGTVGLSTGVTRAELEPVLKAVLCIDMLLGRLEVFAILVALSPRTWIGRRVS